MIQFVVILQLRLDFTSSALKTFLCMLYVEDDELLKATGCEIFRNMFWDIVNSGK